MAANAESAGLGNHAPAGCGHCRWAFLRTWNFSPSRRGAYIPGSSSLAPPLHLRRVSLFMIDRETRRPTRASWPVPSSLTTYPAFHAASKAAMAAVSPDSRRSMQRRDSSTSTGKRRPRLLRACATEPSITTSVVSRGALANPQSSRRATDLLSRVAYISGTSPESLYRGSSPPSAQSPIYDRIERVDSLSSSPTSHNPNLDEIRPYPCSFYPPWACG